MVLRLTSSDPRPLPPRDQRPRTAGPPLSGREGRWPSPSTMSDIFSVPLVRPDKVAEARALLSGEHWCRAREVAEELVDCLVGCRFP